jgi:LmbE family N-acetylglucosaminyl deacetylase
VILFVFVSPHLDDVALSCGGLAYRLASQGQHVVVVTVCTADTPPGEPRFEAAKRVHAEWQLGNNPYRHRREEDIAASSVLGTRSVHLGLPDAVYRRDEAGQPLYTNDFMGGVVHLLDWQHLYPAVVSALRPLLDDADRVYSPLAIGGHVDHIIVRRAVETLVEPQRVRYFEDFPYAGRADWHSGEVVDGLAPNPEQLSEAEREARIRAIACYPSQMVALFGSVEAMPMRVRNYIASAGGERYWQTK